MAFSLADMLKAVSDSGTDREQIEYIRRDLIDSDENNFYQLSDIEGLADNIAFAGLQQPIRVRKNPDNDHYTIISGHRRRAAIELLAKDEPEKWQEVSCIVQRDGGSPALQQLQLIFANSSTRKLTPAEISEQTVQVEKLLYQLKEEEGYEFPGRMRDHVAQVVGVSKSKIARLKVIRENLAACWAEDWKNGTIGESVAYNLSQMPKSWQTVIHTVWGEKANKLYADTVSNAKGRFEWVCKIQCKHGCNLCEHTVIMMQKDCKEMYYAPCIGCCFDCCSLRTCKNCCPQAVSKQKEMKAAEKQAMREEQQRLEKRDRPGAEFARLVWERIGKARERSGASIKDIVLARGESLYDETCDDPKQKRMESGEGNYSPNSTVSFGYGVIAADMMKVVAVADALQCSVDYLLGRTDRIELVSDLGTGWQAGEPSKRGDYVVIIKFPYEDVHIKRFYWDGSQWMMFGIEHDPEIDGEIIGWILMPDGACDD